MFKLLSEQTWQKNAQNRLATYTYCPEISEEPKVLCVLSKIYCCDQYRIRLHRSQHQLLYVLKQLQAVSYYSTFALFLISHYTLVRSLPL